MPIRSDTNLYPGVNPHLNSELQQTGGGWQGFHAEFIVRLREQLDEVLPDNYYPSTERGMQIVMQTGDDRARSTLTTRADVQVFKTHPSSGRSQPALALTPVVATFPLAETFEDDTSDETYIAIAIYRVHSGRARGTPVTRLELLSPGNKPGGRHHESYSSKRQDVLKQGINLVELDLLHETPPVLTRLASYKHRQAGAYPYYCIVNDVRNRQQGLTHVYGAGILQRLPIIEMPLTEEDAIALDMQASYNSTMHQSREFRRILTDYAEVPVNFGAYTEADQQAIRQHMAQIAAEHAAS